MDLSQKLLYRKNHMLNNPLTQKTKRIQHGAVEYVEDNGQKKQEEPISSLPPRQKKKSRLFEPKMAKKTTKNSTSPPPSVPLELLLKSGEQENSELQNLLATAIHDPDPFIVVCDVFQDSWVDSVQLPKMVLRSTGQKQQTVKEKSTVLVHLENDIQNISEKMHGRVLSGAKKDTVKFEILWIDPETLEHENPKVVSVWKLLDAKVVAIDFGSAEYERKEKALIAIEFEYTNINIDGTEI